MLPGRVEFLTVLCLWIFQSIAQVPEGQVARFTFNGGAEKDEVTGERISKVGVINSRDRFGNKDNAVYLSGDAYSYINLGSGKRLKQPAATIALWVRIHSGVFAGKGYFANPLLLTKSTKKSDFYEAYALYYDVAAYRLGLSAARDSLRQTVILDMDSTRLGRWYHVAMSYDDESIILYVNGKLVHSRPKHWRTIFDATDSVLVGVSNNEKNNRFARADIDDIYFYNRVLNPAEIEGLYHAPDPDRRKVYYRWGLIILLVLLLVMALFVLIRYRLSQAHKKEKQALELQNVMLETELRVNRALMNPHFVFNSMNTLQNFILKNENERANRYLVRFSKLLRQVLESNMTNSIALSTEVELLERYLEIEDMRFEENIRYEISITPDINPLTTRIPIMMIQPFVENAIWHGLLKKEGAKELKVSFTRVSPSVIRCTVDDNGGGRKKSSEQSGNKSLAIRFIEQRLDLLNRIHQMHCRLEIIDKPDGAGTMVSIELPVLIK